MKKFTSERPDFPISEEYLNNELKISYPIKTKRTAGILAIVFGMLGVNYFYLRHYAKGIIILIITCIPLVVNIVFNVFLNMDNTSFYIFWCCYEALFALRGLLYIIQSDERFCVKNRVRSF